MDKLINAELRAPFDNALLRQVSKGGTSLTYVPIAEVIARLNFILGTENWGISDLQVNHDPEHSNWLISKCELWAKIGDEVTTKCAYAGSMVKLRKADQTPVDLGDDYKSAASDALKKAAQQLGLGLELARSEEALAIEDHESAVREVKDEPKAAQELLDTIETWAKAQEGDSLNEFKTWWAENVRFKIQSGNVTQRHAEMACERFGITLESSV